MLSAFGSVVAGVVLAKVYFLVTARVREVATAVVLQFLGTFFVWTIAESVGLSPVLTLVAYAITIARTAPQRTGGARRRSSYAVWEVVVFVLNVLAFILMGLQLRGIVARLDDSFWHAAGFAVAVLLVVVVVRVAWVMTFNAAIRWKVRRFGQPASMMRPTVAGGVAISWCGMRGIVTLAAALALPAGFPQRDLIVFTAFSVVLGTLVVQGMTLRPLLAWLPLPEDDSVERETALARTEAARAALAALGADRASEAGHVLAQEIEARIADDGGKRQDATGLLTLRARVLAAERTRLAALRREGVIGDHAFHIVEEELDWAEADVQQTRDG